MAKWLQETPKTTSIRVNCHHASAEAVKVHILKTIMDLKYIPSCPKIDIFQPIPEIILIHHIDANVLCERNQENKEVIVDVPCGKAVLRGSHIFAAGVLAMEPNTNVEDIVNIFIGILHWTSQNFM